MPSSAFSRSGISLLGRRTGLSGSLRLARGQPQAGQEQLAVLGLTVRQIARDQWSDRAQPGDDRACFVEPPCMGIARGEKAVSGGRAGLVLDSQEQLRRRFIKL